jgi:transposase
MAYNFRGGNRDQGFLLPPDIRDWIPESDLAWFVVDAVKEMDLQRFYRKYRRDGRGGASYPPEMMVSLLLYSYCLGERSSRRIEQLCERDVAYRVITANSFPDHSTISRFRQAHENELAGLFVDVLRLCAEAKLVKVGLVALDGTKIKANAALAANRTHAHLAEEVKQMLDEAEAVDKKEDALYGKANRGDELPEALRSRKSRLARLKECKERLEREAADKAARQARKIAEREAEEKASGKKKRGRKPKKPDPAPGATKANVTDPPSRIMKTRKGYEQAYNAQAATTEEQIIVVAEVTQDENDQKQYHPMIKQAAANLEAVGVKKKIGAALADAGYWSKATMEAMTPDAPEPFIATTKDWKQRKAMRERPPPRGRIPEKLDIRDRMERKLLTKRGRKLYQKRSQTVEPVFGQIKDARGIDRFMRRGLGAADSEWKIICATHNLLKLFRSGKANWN